MLYQVLAEHLETFLERTAADPTRGGPSGPGSFSAVIPNRPELIGMPIHAQDLIVAYPHTASVTADVVR